MGLSSGYGKVGDNTERFKVLDHALLRGSTFWDTSDIYADNEDLLGAWFKHSGKRDQIFLCTKFGVFIGADGKPSIRSDKAYVKEACDKSLKRLGVNKIDLYYCHRVDMKTPIEETVTAMAELKKEGKIGAIGLSEISAATLRRACKIYPIDALQIEYSPFSVEIESSEINLLKTCRELGVTVVAYSPLGRGFLTGQIKSPDDFEEGDFRKHAPRYSKENFPKNLKLVTALEEIAKTKKCTTGQLALAWLLAQGPDIIPIPSVEPSNVSINLFANTISRGTKNIKYLDQNVDAAKVELSPADVQAIRDEIEKVEVVGERYPGFFAKYSFADTPEP
jgi:aryl-alcohol dehydrogenase-like predicted oxidoreductase